MGNASSTDGASGSLGVPNLLSKVSVSGLTKAHVDAFLTHGKVDNVDISYNTKKQHERFNPRNVNRDVVLTHCTLKLVKRNWTRISENREAQSPVNSAVTPLVILYDTFFARLFMLEPSMRMLFEENMIRQSKFLVGLVNIMVGMESMLKQGLRPVYSFADRAVGMGVRPEHYEVIAAALPIALEALQSCAGSEGWTKPVANAWWDVMSFAILAVVERTVESWGSSHGMSLSEMWNALYEWRTQTKLLHLVHQAGVYHSEGKRVPDSVRRMSTMSTMSTATSSMGSNGSIGPPEAPPPLRQRGPKLDLLVAPGRSPMRDKNPVAVNGSSGGGEGSNRTGDGTYTSPPMSACAKRANGNGCREANIEDRKGDRPKRAWSAGEETSEVGRAHGGNDAAVNKHVFASTAPPSAELDVPSSACYLSDEHDGMSSSTSPSVAGSGPVGIGKMRNNGSGGLNFSMAGSASGGSEISSERGCLRTSTGGPLHRQKTDPFRVSISAGSLLSAGGAMDASSSTIVGGRESSAIGSSSLADVSASPDRPLSTDGTLHSRAAMALGTVERERRNVTEDNRLSRSTMATASITTGGGAAAGAAAGASGGGVSMSSGGGGVGGGNSGSGGAHGKTFGSMVLQRGTFGRRKKITRSASLEDDEELNHRRQRASSVGRHHELSGTNILRGRGREGSMAMMAGADFDISEELAINSRTRRRGIVSRMRRMGSNVMRFRSGSRHHHHPNHHGNGVGNSLHTYNSQGSASIGGRGSSISAAVDGSGGHGPSRNGGINSRGGVGISGSGASLDGTPSTSAHRLRVSAVSPATAVPTPATATPAAGATATSPHSRGRNASSNGGASGAGAGNGAGGGGGSGRKPASRAHSTGELETERERKALKAKAGRTTEEIRRRGMVDPHVGVGADGNGTHPKSGSSSGRSSRAGSGAGNARGRPCSGSKGDGQDVPVNPWRQMKLHELMATLEDNSGEETEKNFAPIAEAILYHLGPSEPPTTRAVALDVAQTFVQRVLSSRSKDKKSSKVRRKAFKELLSQLIPLMLDCLKSPGWVRLPGGTSASAGSRNSIPASGSVSDGGKQGAARTKGGASTSSSGVDGVGGISQGGFGGTKGVGGEVVVLHYYQQHHQYLLKVAVLETMNRFLMVLRALFRPPQSTSVQKAVAPLLDAEEEVLREKAAAVLGKLSLCGKDNLKWVNIAIKVSLEAHNLLQDAWPDEGVGQIPSKQVESIMGDHPLLPPVQDTFRPGDAEAHVRAVGRRFPALCKLLATLITASPPPKSHESDTHTEDGSSQQQGDVKSLATSANQRPLLVSLAISLVQRVLRMGQQAWDFVESQDPGARGDTGTASKIYLTKIKGTLSPELASRVTGLLLPAAVTLLEALVASSKLEDAMKDQHEAICLCMGQAIAQMPVQGGVRYAAYRAMAVIIRYLQEHLAAVSLGVPVLPLLFNEALLALGNRMKLHPLNTKRELPTPPPTPGGSVSKRPAPPLCFNMRTPTNNGHGTKINEDTVWAGVECLASLIWDCGLHLPPAQIAQVESVVSEGVELLAHRPLEVSPFDQYEPQVLRHPATREAFVRLAHHYLRLSEGKGRTASNKLYSEAMLAFHCHLQDPDEAVARECRSALAALKGGNVDVARDVKRADQVQALEEDMEVEADHDLHSATGEGGWALEEGENGEFHVVRKADRSGRRSPSPLLANNSNLGL